MKKLLKFLLATATGVLLIACGGGYSVASYRQMEDRVNALFLDPEAATSAGNYVRSHVGATDFIYNQLFQ